MSKFANSLIIHIFATLNSQVTNVENIQAIKQRFGIIGNDPKLNRTLEKAIQVAPTDISVLITGESGVGKEAIPRIIHSLSMRKHGKYIAVNCGLSPKVLLILNSLVTKKALSQGQLLPVAAILKKPMVVLFS